METRFVVQGQIEDSGYLLAEILEAAKDATSGGAAFSWTTVEGSQALFEDTAMSGVLENGTFMLIVGLDLVTNTRAIQYLESCTQSFQGFEAKAFMHTEPRLFHPKFCWFSAPGRLTLIAGSGNLTISGLRRNWEAFTVSVFAGNEAEAMERYVVNWLSGIDDNLLAISDSQVALRAQDNTGVEPAPAPIRLDRVTKRVEPTTTEEVLLAEIPRSNNRWSQANFPKEIYENFFGALAGTQRRVIFYQVMEDGKLSEPEIRPSVEVKSQNYRFELTAAKGHPYPVAARPIGIFRKLQDGVFVYQVLLPDATDFDEARAILSERCGEANGPRRLITTISDLISNGYDSVIWSADPPRH